ncbi:hypothetical protein DBV15_06386 [Temnothorax longispinosus]|uniref:Uncharacterized protein n=1 Tax=Temnothorax longispinosus TaxID=300112 RepID=A0A4S2KD15_9HYME|nr:hypothetical protein DBV15_06386 [Temnothorax longispinosus]
MTYACDRCVPRVNFQRIEFPGYHPGNARQEPELPDNIGQRCTVTEKKSVAWYRKNRLRAKENENSPDLSYRKTREPPNVLANLVPPGFFAERDDLVETAGDAVHTRETGRKRPRGRETAYRRRGRARRGTGGPASLGRMLSSGDKMHLLLHHRCRGADHLTGSALDYGVTQSPPYPSRLMMTVISADDGRGDDNNDGGDGATETTRERPALCPPAI